MTNLTLTTDVLSLAKDVVYVPPVADETGETNAANLQRAIDELDASVDDWGMGTVFVSGTYPVNRGLRFGDINKPSRVRLEALGTASIVRVGEPDPSSYLVSIFGQNRNDPTVLIGGVRLFCRANCRGILCADTHLGKLQNCMVYGPVGSGIDLVRNWWMDLDHVWVHYPQGFAIRGSDNSGSRWDSVGVIFGNPVPTTYWPPDNDPSCVSLDGTLRLQNSTLQRSLFYLSASGTLVAGLTTENCDTGIIRCCI